MTQKPLRFTDRFHAGRLLASALVDLSGDDHVIVYGLPRGGVPIAYEVALALDAPLDVVVVRKLGVPGRPELAMGAVASGDITVLDEQLISALGIAETDVEKSIREQRTEVRERQELFGVRDGSLDPKGATVVVVDDGMATGSTMRASVDVLRQLSPGQLIVAVPVASRQACTELSEVADRVVCLSTPDSLVAVGGWYDDFNQFPSEEVVRLLESARNRGDRSVR